MALFGLLGRKRHERTGFTLYTEAVRTARTPVFYAALGVPDTLDGRFDMIGLFVCLVIDRLRREPEPGPGVAQAVFDAMFSDMDHTLREMGVSDMTVGRKVKAMWEALHGRALAYAPPLEAGDEAALADALARNVWRGQASEHAPEHAPAQLARIAFEQRAALQQQTLADLGAGRIRFVPIPALAPA